MDPTLYLLGLSTCTSVGSLNQVTPVCRHNKDVVKLFVNGKGIHKVRDFGFSQFLYQ